MGGTASYSAIAAKALGQSVSIVTSTGKDFRFKDTFDHLGINFHNKPSEWTTIFENIYIEEGRTQYLRSRANLLTYEDIPSSLRDADIFHICLIANELDFTSLPSMPGTLVGASIQGSIRKWDEKGLVYPGEMTWSHLDKVDVVVLSKEDISGHEYFLDRIKEHVDQTVVTMGKEGAIVYTDQEEHFFPSYPIKEIEATGAGDVFTTAYLIKYHATKDFSQACIFAHCAASIVIEGEGVENLKSLDQIEDRVQNYERLIGT